MDAAMYANQDEDSLLLEIGRAISISDQNALPPTESNLRKQAERWIGGQSERLRDILCSNQAVRSFSKSGFSNELVLEVIVLIESLAYGVASAPLAVLLCKRGIEKLCKDVC